MKTIQIEVKTLIDLKADGYTLSFRREATCIYCIELHQWIFPEEFNVDKFYFFKRIAQPDADRMLYAISSTQGVKGILVDTWSVYTDNISIEMIEKLNYNNMKNYDTLVDALDDLKKRGYDEDFATAITCLYCGDLDIRLNPEEFNIDEVYRFDGDSTPDGSSIIYAITSSTGVKGTLVDSYGAYSANLSFDMIKKLQHHQTINS